MVKNFGGLLSGKELALWIPQPGHSVKQPVEFFFSSILFPVPAFINTRTYCSLHMLNTFSLNKVCSNILVKGLANKNFLFMAGLLGKYNN